MSAWIGLFRGINVGGNNLLPMKELRDILEKMGCTGVQTYIQSGNIVFSKSAINERKLTEQISETILQRKGFKPKVFLLRADALAEAVRSNPFREAEADPKSVHLFFLADKPKSKVHQAIDDIKSDSERFLLTDLALYLYAPDGIGRSKLAAKAEKVLGVDVTARNWRTATKLLELAGKRN